MRKTALIPFTSVRLRGAARGITTAIFVLGLGSVVVPDLPDVVSPSLAQDRDRLTDQLRDRLRTCQDGAECDRLRAQLQEVERERTRERTQERSATGSGPGGSGGSSGGGSGGGGGGGSGGNR